MISIPEDKDRRKWAAAAAVASALWASILAPLMGSALGWLLVIAAMVGDLGLSAKAIVILGVLHGAADLTLPAVWTGYGHIRAPRFTLRSL